MKREFWPCGSVMAAAVLAAVGLTAMAPAVGAGVTLREVRPVTSFERVALDAPGELLITQAGDESLVVEAEAQVLPLLRTRVESGTLVIGVAGSVHSRSPIRYHLRLRTLSALRADGSSEVQIGALHAPMLSVHLAGASRARVGELTAERIDIRLEGASELQVQRGRVRRQQVRIDDAATYDAHGLRTDDAQIEVRGSGQARVHAERLLDAHVGNSASLSYSGSPRVTQQASGAAELLPSSR